MSTSFRQTPRPSAPLKPKVAKRPAGDSFRMPPAPEEVPKEPTPRPVGSSFIPVEVSEPAPEPAPEGALEYVWIKYGRGYSRAVVLDRRLSREGNPTVELRMCKPSSYEPNEAGRSQYRSPERVFATHPDTGVPAAPSE